MYRNIILLVCALSLSLSASALTVTNVSTKLLPETDQASNQNFSTFINFTPDQNLNSPWAFGFYMPRSFNFLVSKYNNNNPDISMKICQANTTNCADLAYIKQGDIKPDLSSTQIYATGYTNILQPKTSFPLKPGVNYQIEIAKSNQWAPANINSMPQNYFIISDLGSSNQHITTANAAVSAYGNIDKLQNIGGYDAKKIATEIKQHNQQNWNNSKPLNANNFSNKYHLVPTPENIEVFGKQRMPDFNLETIPLTFTSDFNNDPNKSLFANYLMQDLKLKLTPVKSGANITIKKADLKNPEGYVLTINSGKIDIQAKTPAGAFYAIQTLRQLWSQGTSLPSLRIIDAPRFPYRGVLLDVARHYQKVSDIEKLIDAMAALKLNTLHIHFSDDEAWRLPVNALPQNQLTSAASRGYVSGSINPAAMFMQNNLDISNYKNFEPNTGSVINKNYPSATTAYVGQYSKQKIQLLIRYANARQITIIPEIDLPGHARALANAAKNIFMDPNDKSDYISVQGYYNDVIPVCQFNQNSLFTYTMASIISDIQTLFANQNTVYAASEVSVGGDEVSAGAWSKDSSCQGVWSGLSALDKSQYFFNLLQQTNPNILLSGWQQTVQKDGNGTIGNYSLAAKNTGHIWVWAPSTAGINQAKILANAGYKTVLAFADETYFDLTYTPNAWEPGFNWAGSFVDTQSALKSAASSTAVISGLAQDKRKNIVGLEGTLWGENMPNIRHLAYMALPKMTGLAEAAWSPASTTTNSAGQVNWQSLAMRLGIDKKGFLNYLYQVTDLQYRGFPYGIQKEIPQTASL